MHCIKTGANLYCVSTDTSLRIDIFTDGTYLYCNNNDVEPGKLPNIDIECDYIEASSSRYNHIIRPVVAKKLIDYVEAFKFKSYMDELFLSKYK